MNISLNKALKLIYLLIGLSVVSIIIGFGFYIYFMSPNEISSSPESWAQFGSFFSGFINPFLALINICVFVMLTLVIQRASDRQNDENIKNNKAIALINLKYAELSHFKEEMDKKISVWEQDFSNLDRAQEILYTYNVLEYRMIFLFPELHTLEHNKSLRKYIVSMITSIQENDFNMGVANALRNTYAMLVSELGELIVK